MPKSISTTRSFLRFSFFSISIDSFQPPPSIFTPISPTRLQLAIDLLAHSSSLALPFPSRTILPSTLYTLISISAIIVTDISFPQPTTPASPVDVTPCQLLIDQLSPFRDFHEQESSPYGLSDFLHYLVFTLPNKNHTNRFSSPSQTILVFTAISHASIDSTIP